MSAWTPPTTERERLARILRCVAAKAKTDREAGKRIGRDKPARGEDQRGGGKTKAGK